MEGRWAISREECAEPTCQNRGRPYNQACAVQHHAAAAFTGPVVPCDDAAVERAEAIVEDILAPYASALSPAILSEQIVEAVLRAAGEVPS